MEKVYLQSVSVIAPGLPDWPTYRAALVKGAKLEATPIPRANLDFLPANERRRVTAYINIALQAAQAAMKTANVTTSETSSVFASTYGDLEVCERICTALTLPERPVSPIDFHNSVHNAPQGYWAIGNRCRMSSTSLCAGTVSFATGLLESMTQTIVENCPVLFVAYDIQPPPALAGQKISITPFAVALVITNEKTTDSLASLKAERVDHQPDNYLVNEYLESIRSENPAAQGLLITELVAKEIEAFCVLPYLDSGGLKVTYTPC